MGSKARYARSDVHSRPPLSLVEESKNIKDHLVYVVDDDSRVREALGELLVSHDFRVFAFESAFSYMQFVKPDLPACLILDVGLPDINGLDLQKQISGTGHPPIVFITGRGDIPSSVRALKLGAVDFLTKPISEEDLLEAIRAAITQDGHARLARSALSNLQQCYSSLTPREREVLPLVVSGLLNKQSAAELGISEITLQIHRSKIMKKMRADSLAELVRMAGTLRLPITRSRHA